MTDHKEKLIEEAAEAICKAHVEESTYGDLAVAALAVFEKAHTPTDGEREALASLVNDNHQNSRPWRELVSRSGLQRTNGDDYAVRTAYAAADAILAAGFRRSEVPEPSAEEWSTENRRAAMAEAKRRFNEWWLSEDPMVKRYAEGSINGFTLGAEWWKSVMSPEDFWRWVTDNSGLRSRDPEQVQKVAEREAERFKRGLWATCNGADFDPADIKRAAFITGYVEGHSAAHATPEPQGEPSDAQVEAIRELEMEIPGAYVQDDMDGPVIILTEQAAKTALAALRAAGEAGRG